MSKDNHQYESGKAILRPKARLLRTLGKELISSDKVALIELVKNSYDADATIVLIRLYGPLNKGMGRIEVWDDGHGMDLATVKNTWLEIATDIKRQNKRSIAGRRVLGEKGIGRLAVARLGEEMKLTTRKDDEDEVNLLIDWKQFDREDAYLDEIDVDWEVGAPLIFTSAREADNVFSSLKEDRYNKNQGTVIQINKLNSNWEKEDILEIRTALTRLVRPSPRTHNEIIKTNITPKIDFEIILEFLDLDESWASLSGPIEPPSDLQIPHYRLSGSIANDGTAELEYEQQYPPRKEHINNIQLWHSNMKRPSTGPFDFSIQVWDRETPDIIKSLLTIDPKITAPTNKQITDFRNALDDLAGVSIYRDGFRVLPYGEKGNDWLELDRRRVNNPTLRLSNNQIIGNIFIGADTNQSLEDQSNREGIMAGPAYSDLKVLVKAALNELEQRRFRTRRKDKVQDNRKLGLFDRFDLSEISTVLEINYPKDKKVIALINKKNKDIQKGVKQVQTVLSRYSRLATLGTLIDRILHDGRTVVARLKSNAIFGAKDLDKSSIKSDDKIDIAINLMQDTAQQAELLSTLFNQIAPFGGRKRGRPKQISIHQVIDRVMSLVHSDASRENIELVCAASDFTTSIDEAELLTVLLNLVQNAIFWTATQPPEVKRQIVIDATLRKDGSLTVVVSDSGPGVSVENRDHIFDPYFSTKPDGIGLGLSIVGNIVEDIYSGELILVDSGPLTGATFEATFRRRVS